MKIRMLTSMAGDGFVHNRGDIVEMSNQQAKRLIAVEFAEKFDEQTASTQETAAQLVAVTAERDALAKENDELKQDIEALRGQIDALTAPPSEGDASATKSA